MDVDRSWLTREVAEFATKPGPHRAMYVNLDPSKDGIAVGWAAAETVGDAERKAKANCEAYRKPHGNIPGACVLLALDDRLSESGVSGDLCDAQSDRYQTQLRSLLDGTTSISRPLAFHYTSGGRYVPKSDGFAGFEVWVTNDGRETLSCSTTVAGAVPGGPNAETYTVEKTEVVSPGHTVVFSTMRDTVAKSAKYAVQCVRQSAVGREAVSVQGRR